MIIKFLWYDLIDCLSFFFEGYQRPETVDPFPCAEFLLDAMNVLIIIKYKLFCFRDILKKKKKAGRNTSGLF